MALTTSKEKTLPKWMTAPAVTAPEQAALLEAAAKVVREFSRQVRADGHTEFARHAVRIAESIEYAANGQKTWAQAFDLD